MTSEAGESDIRVTLPAAGSDVVEALHFAVPPVAPLALVLGVHIDSPMGSSYKRLIDEPDDLEHQIVGERLRNSPR
jgi:hypothetical protein